jgi:hypothetical protein
VPCEWFLDDIAPIVAPVAAPVPRPSARDFLVLEQLADRSEVIMSSEIEILNIIFPPLEKMMKYALNQLLKLMGCVQIMFYFRCLRL